MDLILLLVITPLVGALVALWVLMVADSMRRSFELGARLAWLALMVFAPVLGFFVYYFTVVSPAIAVPESQRTNAGGLLVSNRGQVALFLTVIALSLLIILATVPASLELPPSSPTRLP